MKKSRIVIAGIVALTAVSTYLCLKSKKKSKGNDETEDEGWYEEVWDNDNETESTEWHEEVKESTQEPSFVKVIKRGYSHLGLILAPVRMGKTVRMKREIDETLKDIKGTGSNDKVYVINFAPNDECRESDISGYLFPETEGLTVRNVADNIELRTTLNAIVDLYDLCGEDKNAWIFIDNGEHIDDTTLEYITSRCAVDSKLIFMIAMQRLTSTDHIDVDFLTRVDYLVTPDSTGKLRTLY